MTYELYGALGSPYSLKMRAVLRYRRLPHLWKMIGLNSDVRSHVKVPVIPIMRLPGGTYMNDSTPLIEALEAAHADRSLVPDDPGDAFLAWLLEDMADEWGTKMMFHYRWAPEEDQYPNAFTIAQQSNLAAPRERVEAMAQAMKDRQVGRMALVGCTPANAPAIESTARLALSLLDAHVPNGLFLFGSRPSVADFGWYGQFSQLARDATPRRMIRDAYPAAFTWIETLDDASGLDDGAWRDPAQPPSPALAGFLALAGDVYLPFLAENARAQASGQAGFAMTLAGHPYSQAPFGYQAKCLATLKGRFADLPTPARERVGGLLGPAPTVILAG